MRRPDRTRYLDAVRHIEHDEVPFQELEFAHHAVEELLGKRVPRGRCYELPADDLVALHRAAGCDMVYFACLWELGRRNVIDAEGQKHYVDGLFKTRASLRDIAFPDLGAIRHRIEEVARAAARENMGLIYGPNPIPFLVTTAVGYQDYYEALITDPGFIREFQGAVSAWCLEELDIALACGVDVVRVGGVLCTKQGPMMALSMMEEFEFPYMREAVGRTHAAGRLALLHSDGNLTTLLPLLADMGFDILHPVEPCDGAQDIYELKRRFGRRLALHGNIDVGEVLARGSQTEIRRATLEHLERLSPGGGYICGSSHDISPDVPFASFAAMRDTALAYRRTGR